MSRLPACLRSPSVRRGRAIVFLLLLGPLALPAVADEETPAFTESVPQWPTPEGAAYAAARKAAGEVFLECVRAAQRADDALSVAATRTRCAKAGEQYASYLPADKTDEALDLIVSKAKSSP